MPAVRWNATVVDSPGSEPFTIIGDLVLAVRTPRSRDFVTVEVAPTAECGRELAPATGVRHMSRPSPCLPHEWQGEVRLGDTVAFWMNGASYRLTLAGLAESPDGLPWVVCEFRLERD